MPSLFERRNRAGATSFEVVRLNLTTKVQFLSTARNVKKIPGRCYARTSKRFSKYGQYIYIYQIAGNLVLSTNLALNDDLTWFKEAIDLGFRRILSNVVIFRWPVIKAQQQVCGKIGSILIVNSCHHIATLVQSTLFLTRCRHYSILLNEVYDLAYRIKSATTGPILTTLAFS